jgi:hypothetical protein
MIHQVPAKSPKKRCLRPEPSDLSNDEAGSPREGNPGVWYEPYDITAGTKDALGETGVCPGGPNPGLVRQDGIPEMRPSIRDQMDIQVTKEPGQGLPHEPLTDPADDVISPGLRDLAAAVALLDPDGYEEMVQQGAAMAIQRAWHRRHCYTPLTHTVWAISASSAGQRLNCSRPACHRPRDPRPCSQHGGPRLYCTERCRNRHLRELNLQLMMAQGHRTPRGASGTTVPRPGGRRTKPREQRWRQPRITESLAARAPKPPHRVPPDPPRRQNPWCDHFMCTRQAHRTHLANHDAPELVGGIAFQPQLLCEPCARQTAIQATRGTTPFRGEVWHSTECEACSGMVGTPGPSGDSPGSPGLPRRRKPPDHKPGDTPTLAQRYLQLGLSTPRSKRPRLRRNAHMTAADGTPTSSHTTHAIKKTQKSDADHRARGARVHFPREMEPNDLKRKGTPRALTKKERAHPLVIPGLDGRALEIQCRECHLWGHFATQRDRTTNNCPGLKQNQVAVIYPQAEGRATGPTSDQESKSQSTWENLDLGPAGPKRANRRRQKELRKAQGNKPKTMRPGTSDPRPNRKSGKGTHPSLRNRGRDLRPRPTSLALHRKSRTLPGARPLSGGGRLLRDNCREPLEGPHSSRRHMGIPHGFVVIEAWGGPPNAEGTQETSILVDPRQVGERRAWK